MMISILGGSCFLCSCFEGSESTSTTDQIEITATRPLSSIDQTIRLHVSSEERLGGLQPSPFEASAPNQWRSAPRSEFRLLNYRFSSQGEVYVSLSSGGLLENMNRWKRQFGKDPLTPKMMNLSPRVDLLGQRAFLIQEEGTFQGGMGQMSKKPTQGWALLGALLKQGDQIITVKMIGPEDEVHKERPSFLTFCKTLRWKSASGSLDSIKEAPQK